MLVFPPLKRFDAAIDAALCILTGSTNCVDEEARVALVMILSGAYLKALVAWVCNPMVM